MGDKNQRLFMHGIKKYIDGSIVEIGSKDYGNTENFRALFPSNRYLGIDISPGPGVDLVADIELGIEPLGIERFSFGVCCSVLEHTARPWVLAERLSELIEPEGFLFISVPWVWRYHPYPDDFFRFSPKGVVALFPNFSPKIAAYSTNVPGEFIPIDLAQLSGLDDRMSLLKQIPKGQRKYLPYLMVNMFLQKR